MQREAIYVHIPFCKQKCLYCDFPSYAGFSYETMHDYAKAIVKEIHLRSLEANNIKPDATIFFGGGTPSILSVEDISLIVQGLKETGFWKNPREATIEVNPGTADLKKLQVLRELGFDRISFGVQSLKDGELKNIGRIHTAREALEVIRMAQGAGFTRINADVMYGLPGQSLKSLRETLETIQATGIEHISAYSLILEEGTPLEKLVDAGKFFLPEEDATCDMYDFVQKFLVDHGYNRYEISNYALAHGESEHNKVYWAYHPYIGFGAAATSFTGETRFTATRDVKKYLQLVASEKEEKFYVSGNSSTKNFQEEENLPIIYNNEEIYEIESLSKDELVTEFMFMGLRTVRGANLSEAQARFGVDVLREFSHELEPFFKEKLLEYDAKTNYLRLTQKGMAVGNLIFAAFIK